jgi:hypothetical protein
LRVKQFARTPSAANASPEAGFSRAFWIPVGVAFVALQLALLWIEWWPAPRRLWGDENLYATVAERIAARRPAEMDLLWSDFYARALAPFAPLQSNTAVAGRLAVQAVQLALLLVAAASLRGLVRRISGSPRAGDAAAALLLLDPQICSFVFYLWPEVLHLACFLAALWLLVAHGERRLAALGAGALLGVALLAKSVLLPFLPLLALAVVADSGMRSGLARITLVAAVAGAVVAPAVLANGRHYGVYALADSSRFNLWVGFNDRARRDIVDDIAADEYQRWRASGSNFAERDALLKEKIATFVREQGLFDVLERQLSRQYFRLFDKDSFFTNQLPDGAIRVQGYGYAAAPPLFAATLRAWAYAFHALVICLACAGLAMTVSAAAGGSLGPRPAWVGVGLAWIAYTLLIFLGLHVKSRYRVQLWPAFDGFAGAAVAFLSGRASAAPEARWSAPTPPATAGGVLAALLLLFLSFGGPLLG